MAEDATAETMVTVNVQLTRETDAKLERIRDTHGTPKSAFIRIAVAERLERLDLKDKPQQGA